MSLAEHSSFHFLCSEMTSLKLFNSEARSAAADRNDEEDEHGSVSKHCSGCVRPAVRHRPGSAMLVCLHPDRSGIHRMKEEEEPSRDKLLSAHRSYRPYSGCSEGAG